MKKIFHIISLFISIVFASCNAFYVPALVNTPMFEEKNETCINASVGTNGYNFQGAYSFSNNWAIIANARYRKAYSNGYHGKCWSNSHLGELGFGYFKNWGDLKFELFNGLGFDYNPILMKINSWESYTIYRKTNYFIQPSIGAVTQNFEVAFSTKLNSILYGYSNLRYEKNFFPFLSTIEPAITLRAGYKHVKFFYQIGLAIPYFNPGSFLIPEDVTYFNFYTAQYLTMSLGANIKIAQRYKSKKAPN